MKKLLLLYENLDNAIVDERKIEAQRIVGEIVRERVKVRRGLKMNTDRFAEITEEPLHRALQKSTQPATIVYDKVIV